jgi:hypothetical protein
MLELTDQAQEAIKGIIDNAEVGTGGGGEQNGSGE